MKIKLIILPLMLLLTSCITGVPSNFTRELPPSYFVLITNQRLYENSRCAGIVIDEWHVLTAYHCKVKQWMGNRIVTQYNQEVFVKRFYFDAEKDLVLIQTSLPIYVEEYPKFKNPEIGMVGKAYGSCNLFFYFNPRPILNMGNVEDNSFYKKFILNKEQIDSMSGWISYNVDFALCLGDSGGITMQDNFVVGLNNAIISPPLFGYGIHLYTTNGEVLSNFIKEGKKELYGK